MGREKWIDNAKGIAILMVIIGHTCGGLSGTLDFQFVYGIHLVMFFLLSGYTTKKRRLSIEFISAKFRRLMVPYFYTCFAIIVADVINSRILYHDISIDTISYIIGKDLVGSFFASGASKNFGEIDLGTRIGAIWFLPALFFSILIFQCLLQKTEDDRILGICTAAISLLGHISGRFLWFPFSVQSGMFASFFLWIGYEIKKKDLLLKIRWYHYVTAQICLLCGIHFGYCNVRFVYADISDLLLSIPVGLSGCMLIYLISVLDKKGCVLSYFGKISIIVLCVHLFALETMGEHINLFLDRLTLSGNIRGWTYIFVEVLFACLIAAVIDKAKKLLSPMNYKLCEDREMRRTEHRDTTIDTLKGIFICAMLVGHFPINSLLRSIIYSCHMIGFIVCSGYFYNRHVSVFDDLKKTKSLIYSYLLFVVLRFILDYKMWSVDYFEHSIEKYVLGMSFSKNLFKSIESVGPVYFILLLLVTRLLYIAIDRLTRNRVQLNISVISISLFGFCLGQKGLWLPWSIDISCYAVVFYHIGRMIHEKDVFDHIRRLNFAYFVLTPIWAYMIYSGSMEIAVRNYGNYGLVVIGATAGVFTIYQLANYMNTHLPVTADAFGFLGKASMIVLLVHALLRPIIINLLEVRLDKNYCAFMICSIAIQLLLSTVVYGLLKALTKTKVTLSSDDSYLSMF